MFVAARLRTAASFGVCALLVGACDSCKATKADGQRVDEFDESTGRVASSAKVKQAPSFALRDQTGKIRRLNEFRGKHLVLYFYPRDATPGCTVEARAFRDQYEQLKKMGAAVVGVSTDSVASHARFAKDERLPFPLLSDDGGKVAERYGVPVRFGSTGRITFLISPSGNILREFSDVSPDEHAGDVLKLLRQFRSTSNAS